MPEAARYHLAQRKETLLAALRQESARPKPDTRWACELAIKLRAVEFAEERVAQSGPQ